MHIKLALAALCFAILVLSACGCGGGGGDSDTHQNVPLPVSIYGDSYTATDPSTAVQLSDFSNHRYAVTSYAVGGCTTELARVGAPNLPFADFATQMRVADMAPVVLLRYGIADAVLSPNSVAVFTQNLEQFVAQAKSNGKRVMLINMVQIPATPFLQQAALLPVLTSFNAAIEGVAHRTGAELIDLRANVQLYLSDMHSDELHLKPEATLRVNQVLARLLLQVV